MGSFQKPVFYHMVSRMVIRMVSRMLSLRGGGGTPYDYHMVKINHFLSKMCNFRTLVTETTSDESSLLR